MVGKLLVFNNFNMFEVELFYVEGDTRYPFNLSVKLEDPETKARMMTSIVAALYKFNVVQYQGSTCAKVKEEKHVVKAVSNNGEGNVNVTLGNREKIISDSGSLKRSLESDNIGAAMQGVNSTRTNSTHYG